MLQEVLKSGGGLWSKTPGNIDPLSERSIEAWDFESLFWI